jgi:hypothetical protein
VRVGGSGLTKGTGLGVVLGIEEERGVAATEEGGKFLAGEKRVGLLLAALRNASAFLYMQGF